MCHYAEPVPAIIIVLLHNSIALKAASVSLRETLFFLIKSIIGMSEILLLGAKLHIIITFML